MSKIGTATNKKVIDLYNMMQDGTLILQPSFQRNLVWNNTHKENFIETILSQYPFPEVYFADGKIDLEKKISETMVVDGQQRLSTIYEYITNSSDLVLKRIPRFNQLDDDQKTDFYDYIVVVRDLGRIKMDQVKEIFNRINSIQYALNAVEINNALYEGEFIATAKSIQDANVLNDLEIFGDIDVSRMKDLGFITLVMATVEIGGYFTGEKEVEAIIKKYDDIYPNKDAMKHKFIATLDYIKALALPVDSIWFRKSSIFTLISELMFYYNENEALPNHVKTKVALIDLEKLIIENKDSTTDNKYQKFYKYIFQNTSSRQGRIVRGELLRGSLQP